MDQVNFNLDFEAHELTCAGAPIKLERIPMAVLFLLVRRKGQLVTRDEIIETVWSKDRFLDVDNSINTAIRKLRRAFGDSPENPLYIQTVSGRGYRFVGPITTANSHSGAGQETDPAKRVDLVEDETISGPLPLGQAAEYAGQILDALDAAHRKGITYGELKTANIIVTRQGIKLLELGLEQPADATAAPGTLQYMAPEQLHGAPASARTDIFAFGCVFYEMISGRPAFQGETTAIVKEAILEREPAPLDLPAPLMRVIATCLAKDPGERFQSALDLKRALSWVMEQPPVLAKPLPKPKLPWITAAMLGLIVAAGSWMARHNLNRPAEESPLIHVDLDAGSGPISQPAISRDGKHIAFISKGSLAIRRLDEGKFSIIPGTDGASFPFFSPDGRWVAFFANNKLRKMPVEGGGAVTLCETESAGGGTWGDDGYIVASIDHARGLSRISASGGTAVRITDSKADPAGQGIHLWPRSLPGGKGLLFGAANGTFRGSLRVLTPKGQKTLVEDSFQGMYLDSGYLVYHQRGTLFAAPMDLDRLELTGPPMPLVEEVAYTNLRADFDLSASGSLVYYKSTALNKIPVWLLSSGEIQPLPVKPGKYTSPRLSPDGKRLAVSLIEQGKQNLWVYDLIRQTFTRLTFSGEADLLPTWTPDGEFLAFRSGNSLSWMRSDGSGKPERLEGVSPNSGPSDFSRDGKWLTFWPLGPDSDLWVVPVERPAGGLKLGKPRLLLEHAGSKGRPVISPDGRWLAYTSNESRRFETYVAPFMPEGGAKQGKWQVSNVGGFAPIWSPNGRDLFFQSTDQRIQAVAYRQRGDSFLAEKPRYWSKARTADFFGAFDVAPDGMRVVALVPAEDIEPEKFLRLLFNVGSELHRKHGVQTWGQRPRVPIVDENWISF